MRHFRVNTTSHYQIDNATSPLQDANGRLVRYGRFQHLSVNRQNLITLGQSTISVEKNKKIKSINKKNKKQKTNRSVTFIELHVNKKRGQDNCLLHSPCLRALSHLCIPTHTHTHTETSLPARNLLDTP